MKPVLIFALCLLKASSLSAQFKNIKISESVSGHYREPAVMINPDDPGNITINADGAGMFITENGGLSWKKQPVTSVFGSTGSYRLSATAKGTLYVTHLSGGARGIEGSKAGDRLVLHASGDKGGSWEEYSFVGLNPPKDLFSPSFVVDSKGNVFLAWTEMDTLGSPDANCLSNIKFSKSKNGRKWTEPFQLSQTPGSCKTDDQTAAGVSLATCDGKLYAVWSNQEKIYMDRSFDGGEMWLRNDLAVAEQTGGSQMEIPGHQFISEYPSITANNSKTMYHGHLYLTWCDRRTGDADIWMTRTANSGDNWTTPQRINVEGPKHQYMPAVAVDAVTGYLYVIFYDRKNDDDMQTDVVLAFSVDGGTSFKNVRISESSFIPLFESSKGNYTAISAHNGKVAMVWLRSEGEKKSLLASVITHEELVKQTTSK